MRPRYKSTRVQRWGRERWLLAEMTSREGFLGQAGSSIPSTWPRPYDTRYNQETPMEICLNGTPALAYLAVSPREEGPATCPHWTSSI